MEVLLGEGGKRLTAAEYGHLVRVGANIQPHQRPLSLMMVGEQAVASRALACLIGLHPPQPFTEIAFDEIVGAYQFYRYASDEDIVNVEAMCETVAALNIRNAEKNPSATNPMNRMLNKLPWQQ